MFIAGDEKMLNKKGQTGIIIGIIILVILGSAALYGISYGIKYLWLKPKTITTQIDSASKIIDKTYNADNAIYNYEWFKNQYEKIQANRQQVQNTIDQIKEFKVTYGNSTNWDSDTKQEYNRLNTIKLGLQNQDNNLVADYNARSKMANRAIFQDKLPLSIDKILW
jgi:hypothetical protein